MAKTKTSTKKVAARKKTTTKKSPKRGTHVKVVQTCAHPTTLFEVEFPTTLLFWAGVALFFFFILMIAQTIM